MKKQILFALVALLLALPSAQAAKTNFIVVFCDDLGYGDIGPFGSTKHATPVLDQMANEGHVDGGVLLPSRQTGSEMAGQDLI